jgi:hypothetical protein
MRCSVLAMFSEAHALQAAMRVTDLSFSPPVGAADEMQGWFANTSAARGSAEQATLAGVSTTGSSRFVGCGCLLTGITTATTVTRILDGGRTGSVRKLCHRRGYTPAVPFGHILPTI